MLCDKVFRIANNLKNDKYHRRLNLIISKYFNKILRTDLGWLSCWSAVNN